MKWYSIKEYMPPACQEILIRALKKDNSYDWYFLASTEDLPDRMELNSWEIKGRYDLRLDEFIVTHFCILDPVPIEQQSDFRIHKDPIFTAPEFKERIPFPMTNTPEFRGYPLQCVVCGKKEGHGGMQCPYLSKYCKSSDEGTL